MIARIQARADRNIDRFGLLAEEAVDEQALRDHARRRLQPRQQDRLLAHRARRSTCTALPPCNHACPAGENIQELALPRREGGAGYEARLARDHGGQPASRRSWAGSATTRARPPATAGSSTRRSGINSVERFLGDEAIEQGWTVDGRRPPPTGKRVLVVGAGPVRPVGRLPPGAGSATRSRSTRPARVAGGMMRFGIPRYRLPRDVLDAEIAAHPRPRRRRSSSTRKVDGPRRRDARGRLRRRLPRRRRAASASAPTSPPARPRRSSTPSRCCASMEGEERPLLGRRVVGLRRRQHRDGRRPHRQAPRRRGGVVVYRRTRDRMPAHDFEVEEAEEEGVLVQVALDDQAGRRRTAWSSSRWSSTRPASRSRPASSRSSRPTRWCSRSARRPTCRCSTASPASRSTTASSQVGPDLMTGHPGVFAGGDMVPAERTVTVGDRPRQAGRPRASTPGCAARRYQHPARARRSSRSTRSTPGTTPTRRAPCGRSSSSRAAQSTFDEVVRRPRRVDTRCSRRAAACPAATASPATTATASAPTTPCIKLGRPGRRYAIDLDYCKGCGICVAECPCGRDRDGPRGRSESWPPVLIAGDVRPCVLGRRARSVES